MKRMIALMLCLLTVLSCVPAVYADETETVKEAENIAKETKLSCEGFKYPGFLTDQDHDTYYTSYGNVSVTLENDGGIGSLYIMLDYEYGAYTVTNNTTGEKLTLGQYGFLHEFVDLAVGFGKAPTSVTVDFANGSVQIGEIYIFSEGETPDFVQKWEPPVDNGADILLLSTHGDDEHLFFAGLLPYYAGELDLRVQVAYLTDHRGTKKQWGRKHEMLNGLWATGVENYPVFGYGLDFLNESMKGTYQTYDYYNISRNDIVGYVIKQLRRFKPMVVVGHDIKGEYGHGMHMVYTDTLMTALEISNDPQQYPDIAAQYGVWDVPKTYLHLLQDNAIEIDYDIPLESFGGLTAFQVSQEYGYPCHKSQHKYWFTGWIYGKNGEITKATEITTYSPCKFGLYRSTVGEDVLKNDFLENVVCYTEQERLEQERLEQERLEQERLEQERLEQERLEQERLEQERLEQERLEQERLEQERLEQERLEKERQEEEKARVEALAAQIRRRNRITLICFVAVFAGGAFLASKLTNRRVEKNKDLKDRKNIKK